ncbi:MAG: hypothetical protein ACT4PT_02965 [Methanobacteriota archaeon]
MAGMGGRVAVWAILALAVFVVVPVAEAPVPVDGWWPVGAAEARACIDVDLASPSVGVSCRATSL